jgi:hypothetical protein
VATDSSVKGGHPGKGTEREAQIPDHRDLRMPQSARNAAIGLTRRARRDGM